MNELMECPVCGNKYDTLDFTIGENGNPICVNCAQLENKNEDEQKGE